MRERISAVEKRALRRQLRREAMDSWPEYSETLHDRIISAVERSQASQRCLPQRVERWRPSLAAATLAAACLLGVVVLGWQMAQRRNVAQNLKETGQVLREQIANRKSVSPSVDSPVQPLAERVLPTSAAEATIAGLSPIDQLASSTLENLSEMIASAAVTPQSAELKHDTRLAAETLLRRLPVDVELVAGL
jgi:hypothetical protein